MSNTSTATARSKGATRHHPTIQEILRKFPARNARVIYVTRSGAAPVGSTASFRAEGLRHV